MSTTLLSRLDILLTANASGFREEMQGAADESTSSFDKISSGAKKMAGALAGAFAIGAIGVWIDETITAAIELDNLAKAVGTNAQDLQRWQAVAKKSAVEVESVSDAMSTLNEKLLEQATGGDTFLKGLGISAVDAAGNLKTAEDALLEISGAFSEMSDGAAKSAIAADLMGDAGMKLIPILNQGTDAISAQLKAADALGTVLDQKTIQSMRQFKADSAAAGAALDAAKTTILIQLMPTLSKLAGWLADVSKNTDAVRVAVDSVSIVFKIFGSIGIMVGSALDWAGKKIGKMAAIIGLLADGQFRGAYETMRTDTDSFAVAMIKAGASVANYWSSTGKNAAAAAVEVSNASRSTARDLAVLNNMAASEPAAAAAAKPATTAKPATRPDLIVDYAGLFLDQKTAIDAAIAGIGTDLKFQVSFDSTELVIAEYQAMAEQLKQHQNVLTTDLIAIDHGRLAAAKQSVMDQSLFERFLFKSDNEAKVADAQKQFEQETSLSALRLETLNFELQEKIRLVNAAEMQMVIGADEANKQREMLTAEHHARVIEMERSKVDLQRQQWDTAQNFFARGLDAMAAGQGKAAKVAKEINKARALWQIAQDTRSAAMGAYNALAGIPIVGPALAVAAAGAAIGFGALQAKAVLSDAPAGGATVPTASGVSAIVPTADQPQNQIEPQARTTISIPADNIFLGRQLVDLINEAVGDGKGLNVPQFVAV